MTLVERIKVVKLTKRLFPTEVERYPHEVCCEHCEHQVREWDELIWRVYNALIAEGLM